MIKARWVVLCAALLIFAGCGGGAADTPSISPAPSSLQATTLPIGPTAQQTPVWCWAASSEMVFRYYQMPSLNASSYQCGIIASYFGGVCAYNCGLCTTGIGPMSALKTVIDNYGWTLRSLGINSRVLNSQIAFSAITFDATRNEIANGRPIFIGFAPAGGIAIPNVSQHIAVIVGFDASGGRSDVILNDPFPYAYAGLADPYVRVGAQMIQPGQYRVSYFTLVQQLAWVNTIYGVQ